MTRKASFGVILFLILILGLSGCDTLPTCNPVGLPLPNLLSPGFGEVFSIGSDTLSWEFPFTTCEPEGYIIELSDEPDFVNTNLNTTLTSPDTTLNPGSSLQPATKYYWQVTSYVGATVGPTSIQSYFYTEPVCSYGALVAPKLLFPADGSVVTTLNPEFDWNYPDPTCFPDGFHFRVSEDPGMSNFAIESFNPNNWSDEIFFGVPLDDCTVYYYQVTPYVNGAAGPPSEIYKFYIDTMGACECDPASLPVPELVYPEPLSAGNLDIVPVNTVLDWENSGPCTPDGYLVELDDDLNFTDDALNGEVLNGAITAYLPPTLQPATQYWWHVFSTYQGAVSGTSNYASFFTEPECTSQSQLTAPVIIYPKNGDFVDTLTPTLHYIPGITGCIPDHYFIDLQTDQNFQGVTLLGSIAFPTTVVGPSIPLSDCTMYYLKVAAVQNGNTGPYSNVHSFYVNEQGTCFPSPIGKANQNIFCKIGPDWSFGIHLFKTGDWIQAVNRNSDTSYVEVYVPDETGMKPADPQVTCWIPVGAFSPEESIDLREMLVNFPPDPPEEHQSGGESGGESGGGLVCQSSLPAEQCKIAGGFFNPNSFPGTCVCPTPSP